MHEHCYSIFPMLCVHMDFLQIYRLYLYDKSRKKKLNLTVKLKQQQKQMFICIPKIAITTSSFIISSEPRAIKYNDVSTSPLCTNVSPGGACVVLNFSESALKPTK